MTSAELRAAFERLIDEGVQNINLVTPTHFLPDILPALEPKLPVPVVYNCGGYESMETLRQLEGKIDVYLPDFKYSYNELAVKLSSAPNYVETAKAAIKEMLFQVGKPQFDKDDMMTKGVIVRNLILPSHTKNSIGVINILKEHFDKDILVSLMCQYVPAGKAEDYPRLNRKLTEREYDKVKRELFLSGMDGFTQDLSSADTKYIPSWDL